MKILIIFVQITDLEYKCLQLLGFYVKHKKILSNYLLDLLCLDRW